MLPLLLIAAVVGYLLGALPFGYLVARAKGVNIFEVGSKNPGATNVRRVLGRGPGNLVFAFDALKGAAASSWALLANGGPFVLEFESRLTWLDGRIAANDWIWIGVDGLVAALVGHSFSCFTRFRGGKGVATATGGILVLLPLSAVICVAVWTMAFFTTRFVSVASILAALALPVSAWALGRPTPLVVMGILVGGLVILRHRANIVRLLNGTENRFVKKPASTSSSSRAS